MVVFHYKIFGFLINFSYFQMQQQNPKPGNNATITPWKLTRQIMATEGNETNLYA